MHEAKFWSAMDRLFSRANINKLGDYAQGAEIKALSAGVAAWRTYKMSKEQSGKREDLQELLDKLPTELAGEKAGIETRYDEAIAELIKGGASAYRAKSGEVNAHYAEALAKAQSDFENNKFAIEAQLALIDNERLLSANDAEVKALRDAGIGTTQYHRATTAKSGEAPAAKHGIQGGTWDPRTEGLRVAPFGYEFTLEKGIFSTAGKSIRAEFASMSSFGRAAYEATKLIEAGTDAVKALEEVKGRAQGRGLWVWDASKNTVNSVKRYTLI